MKILTYLILLIVVILGVTFAVLNAEPVVINYYIGSHKIPLSLLLVLTFAIGCIVGLSAGMCMALKQKREVYRLRSHVKGVEKEIENLRTIPLKDNR